MRHGAHPHRVWWLRTALPYAIANKLATLPATSALQPRPVAATLAALPCPAMQSIDVFHSSDSDQRDYGLGMRALQLLGSLLRRWVLALVCMLQWIVHLYLACSPTAASWLLRLPAARVAAGGVCATSGICGTSGMQPGAGSAPCAGFSLPQLEGRATSCTAPCFRPLAAQVLPRCPARRSAAQAVPPAAGGRRACAAQPVHVGASRARRGGCMLALQTCHLEQQPAQRTTAADNNRCRQV